MSTETLAWKMGAGIFSQPIEDACIAWGITQPEDKCRFLGNLHVETQGFKKITESTGYSAPRLLEVFSGRNGLATLAQAQQLVKAGPKAVFNFIYGGKWGVANLGNTQPNDGWDFRGRGLIQTTGRANYHDASVRCYGDLRLIENPDLLLTPEGAAQSAACFWYSKGLSKISDEEVVIGRINKAKLHLKERKAETARARRLLDSMRQN